VTFSRWYELQKLYNDYASVLDDGPLSNWPDLFTEQCLYLIQPRDNYDKDLPLAVVRCESRGMLQDRVRAVEETIMYEPRYLRHHITNISADDFRSDEFTVKANYSVIEVLPDQLPRIQSTGRYLDQVVREQEGLRFKQKRVVYDSVLVPNSLIFPL
jgi:salicylate 5-hydroxylase small subunit